MGIIRIHERSKKQNRQAGWAQKAAEYQEWLKKVNSMTTNFARTKPARDLKKQSAQPEPAAEAPKKSIEAYRGGTKAVHRPELVYADNPELLERELAARQRKFNVAPAYNKGPDILVTEEQLVQLLSSNKRRS